MARSVISDITKSAAQITDPAFLKTTLIGIGLSLALLAGCTWLSITGIKAMIGTETMASLPFVGWLVTGSALPLMLILSTFLMVPVASIFTGLFLGNVADAVEEKHYPMAPMAQDTPPVDALLDTLTFLTTLLIANCLALLLYVIFLPFAPMIFLALNGFLLGREYLQIVAMRHMTRDEATLFRKTNAGSAWLLGIALALLLTIPVVNIFVPVIAAASFTHLFHRLHAFR